MPLNDIMNSDLDNELDSAIDTIIASVKSGINNNLKRINNPLIKKMILVEEDYDAKTLSISKRQDTNKQAIIDQAAEKILNLSVYQLGVEETQVYKKKLEHINTGFMLSSSSEPALSNDFRQLLPEFIRDKDKIMPILIHGILKPDHSSFSHNRLFCGISHVIQANKNNDDLDAYFTKARSCKSVCSTITSHWPLKNQIYQELEAWLSSEEAANIANNIDFMHQSNNAKNDLCEALGLLHVQNQYIDCLKDEL